MTDARILHMRVEWFAEHYRGPKFHALICDPPYHLTSITERFGNPDSAPARGDVYARASRGFMGKRWDGGDIAYRPDTWAGLAEHLHPGGFGMAFASSRGWHRLAVAIEDAGLIIHPSIFGWAFGSGFPKATRIDTQVDRDAGAEREVVAYANRKMTGSMLSRAKQAELGYRPDGDEYANEASGGVTTAPATDLAQTWQGHRYGLQALKPALEPIIVFQKPYSGRPVDNITATGAGALWIDGGRVGTQGATARDNPTVPFGNGGRMDQGGTQPWRTGHKVVEINKGRWPANLLLLDDDAAAALDAQSNGQRAGKPSGSGAVGSGDGQNKALFGMGSTVVSRYDDGAGASRFFYRVRAALDAADPVCYTAKASRAEREAGLEGLGKNGRRPGERLTMSGDMPYNETKKGGAASKAPMRANGHPTVKPLDLARYLATLLLPPDEYAPRRILIPFAGSGSECIGAFMAGWDEIVGVEFTREYVDIARARLAYWMAQGVQLSLFDELTA